MWYAYVLQSKKNGHFYIGSTENLKKRLEEHNQGHGGSYTRKNAPFSLLFYEAYLEKGDATSAEVFYKSGYGREVLKGKLRQYLLKNNGV